jgi:hypothetical protein
MALIKQIVDGLPSGDAITQDIIPEGYVLWCDTPKPENNDPTKEVIEGTPVKTSDEDAEIESWDQVWVIQDKTFDDEDSAAAAEAQRIADQWAEVRKVRDEYLARTDWMGNSDVTMPAEIVTWRQALRDITEQEDPFNITWPTDPDNYYD